MKKRLQLGLLTLWLLLPFSGWANGYNDAMVNSIFIINSYTSITQWSDKFIQTIYQNYSTKDSHINVTTEHMNMVTINDEEALQRYKAEFGKKYQKAKPKLIVLLGTSSWVLMHEQIEMYWKGVPVIVCNENQFIGSYQVYLDKTVIPKEERVPLKDYKGNIPLTIFHAPCYVSETIDLMKTLCPKMERLVFLSDRRVISAQYREDVDLTIQSKYPDVKVSHLVSGEISNDAMINTLKNLEENSCVLYSSWFNKETEQGNSIFSSDISMLLYNYTSAPLFILHNLKINQTNGLIGGCFIPERILSQGLISTINSVLDNPPSKEVKVIELGDPIPIINYPDLVNAGLSLSRCPSDALIYNRPPSFWERSWYYFLIGLVLVVIIYIVWLNKIAKERAARLQLMDEYNNLFDNMPIMYAKQELIFDQQGRIVDYVFRQVNPTFEKFIAAKERVIGKRISEIDVEYQNVIAHYNLLLERKELTFQYYFEQTQTYLTIIVASSKKKNFVDIFCFDNSELTHAQQQLRSANHKLSMALEVAEITPWKWDLNRKEIIFDVHNSADNSMPTSVQHTVSDSLYFSNIYHQDVDRVMHSCQQLIMGEITKLKEEFRAVADPVNAPNVYDWIEIQATVDERDKQGKPLSLVGSSLLISQRKTMESDLIYSKERAEEANRLKTAFLANMSHEIRTPLNAIVGFSGILASICGEDNDELQEYVEIIEHNNNLLLQLFNDILDLSKIEAGRLEFFYSEVELNQLFKNIEESSKMKNKNELLSIVFQQNMEECLFRTDPNRLAQVVNNMIHNAMKFTEKGSIQFGFYPQEDSMLYFFVADTGCGILAEQTKTVFERFIKLDSFVQGTGLGLAISQSIVEGMGGKIGVDSVEGKGSTFWFTLPYLTK